LGYRAEEYVGRHIAEFHADAPVIGDILQKLSCGERLDRYPARLRAKDGSVKHVLVTSNSRFSDGKFVNTRCFTMDVTHMREAERARRESEERLAATYEAATVGIAEADKDGRLLRVNDALCKMLGRSREQLLTMTFLDYTDEKDRAEDAANYARQVKGDLDSYVIRKRARKPDGTVAFLDVYGSAVRDEEGQFLYGVRVLQDVTEAKRMEDRIREPVLERYRMVHTGQRVQAAEFVVGQMLVGKDMGAPTYTRLDQIPGTVGVLTLSHPSDRLSSLTALTHSHDDDALRRVDRPSIHAVFLVVFLTDIACEIHAVDLNIAVEQHVSAPGGQNLRSFMRLSQAVLVRTPNSRATCNAALPLAPFADIAMMMRRSRNLSFRWAKIVPVVTVNSFRHSFAEHLNRPPRASS